MNLDIIILAAGKGTRMHSQLPKALQPLAGTTLLEHVVNIAKSLHPQKIHVVYGSGRKQIDEQLGHLDVNWVFQSEQLGTGHAVMQALPHIAVDSSVLILYCDVPLISNATLKLLLDKLHTHPLAIITTALKDPAHFGRIIRDAQGKIIGIVEHKDASNSELQINEINSGIFAGSAETFKKYLAKIQPQNAQGEYYLTDIIKLAANDKLEIAAIKTDDHDEILGVNDKVQLSNLERLYQQKIAQELMRQGLTLLDPNRFDVRGDLKIENDITVDANVVIEGAVSIGAFSKIGPNVLLKNVKIGKHVEVRANSVIEGAIINDNCVVGPFARIRPDSVLAKESHVGNFVEIKNTKLGEGSKANHIAYIGDAIIGAKVNIGAGVITCNYDGANKYQTQIEDGAFIGSDSQLIAPVKIGKNAYVGTGSTITHNVPENKLTLARARQVTLEQWEKPVKGKLKTPKEKLTNE